MNRIRNDKQERIKMMSEGESYVWTMGSSGILRWWIFSLGLLRATSRGWLVVGMAIAVRTLNERAAATATYHNRKSGENDPERANGLSMT